MNIVTNTVTDIHSDLISSCKEGDRNAQRQLYQLYSRPMFSVCMRLLNHREDAEDILQESFISAFNAIETFRQESSFGSWLKRIVVNKSLNHIKKKRIHFEEISETVQIIEEKEEVESDNLDVEVVKKAMKELSEGYRIVFTLYMFENLSHKEIAEELKISVSTSKSQLNRAKKSLKKIIEAKYERG